MSRDQDLLGVLQGALLRKNLQVGHPRRSGYQSIRHALLTFVGVALLGACSTNASYAEVAAPDSITPSPCAVAPSAASSAFDWPVYHRTPDRHGVDTNSPKFGMLKGAWGDLLDGIMLASPVIAGDMVVAATENNTVYGISAATGCVGWSNHLGEAVDATKQPCRPFSTIGITSTPAIDVKKGLVYVVAYIQPARFRMFALDIVTGATSYQREMDLPGGDPATQLSRPAIALANGRVYASFGGRPGDCGNYRGFVIGVAPDLSGELDIYTPPTKRYGAFWAPPGITVLKSGDLLVATGNSESTTTYDGGNSVLRLSPRLKLIDFFAPSNWIELNSKDFDLGSVGPTLLEGGRVFQVGKEGIGYLLDSDHLGGIGGQLKSAFLQGCYAIGGTAYLAPYVYVPCDHGLKAVDVSGGTIRVAWKTLDIRSGSPILAGGVVWNIDFEGGYLYGFNLQDGAVAVRSRVGVSQHFVSPSASNGRLFVPAGKYLLAYTGI